MSKKSMKSWELAEIIFKVDLPPTEKFVMVAIAHHWNEKTENAFPSIKRLQDCTGYSRRTIQKAIDALHARGALWWKHENHGTRTRNIYRFGPHQTGDRKKCALCLRVQEVHPTGAGGALSPVQNPSASVSVTLKNQERTENLSPSAQESQPQPQPQDQTQPRPQDQTLEPREWEDLTDEEQKFIMEGIEEVFKT